MLTRNHEASCRHICNIINAQLLLMLEKIGVVNCLPVATGKAYTVVGPQRSIPGYNFISGNQYKTGNLSFSRFLDHH